MILFGRPSICTSRLKSTINHTISTLPLLTFGPIINFKWQHRCLVQTPFPLELSNPVMKMSKKFVRLCGRSHLMSCTCRRRVGNVTVCRSLCSDTSLSKSFKIVDMIVCNQPKVPNHYPRDVWTHIMALASWRLVFKTVEVYIQWVFQRLPQKHFHTFHFALSTAHQETALTDTFVLVCHSSSL